VWDFGPRRNARTEVMALCNREVQIEMAGGADEHGKAGRIRIAPDLRLPNKVRHSRTEFIWILAPDRSF
jgi:hypothetical protein